MRLEQHADYRSNTRHSTNGSSSHNGSSSPHTNGAASSAKGGSETNGFHGLHTNGHDIVSPSFFGHDREEVTRILLQSLSDLGYSSAAQRLSEESGFALEIPSVAAFRNAVLRGEWEDAEALLFGREEIADPGSGGGVLLGNGHSTWRKSGGENGYARRGLPLAEGADVTDLKFILRQQKYLELLERGEIQPALDVLRQELYPLTVSMKESGRLHALSSYMMSASVDQLKTRAAWDGAAGTSRSQLLSAISKSISPSVMIPEHRLATLLTSVQQEQIYACRYHNTVAQPSLYTDHECLADDFPLQTLTELKSHADEVWYLAFSHDGSMLATAGKDGLVCVYDTLRWKVRHEFREHELDRRNTSNSNASGSGAGNENRAPPDRGVCCVAFSPDDNHLISCSKNNEFVVVNVRNGNVVARADHFDYPVTSAAWLPDSIHFVVGTQGSQRPLGLYSLRPSGAGSSSSGIVKNSEIHSWRDPPWDPAQKEQPPAFRITACAVSRDGARLAATTIDHRLLLYHLPSRAKIADWQMEATLTSVVFSDDGEELLLNMYNGIVLVVSAATGEMVQRYEGAQQSQFVIRSCFGGAGEGFVVSGSEDSRVYIWRRQTGVQVAALDGHAPGTVNAVAWHPTNPAVFASAGDDRRVRIWAAASALQRLPSVVEAAPGASRESLSLSGAYR